MDVDADCFRELMRFHDCHVPLRRHLEQDQRRWMQDDMELFLFRRTDRHVERPIITALVGTRTSMSPYLQQRCYELSSAMRRFLREQLPEDALDTIKHDSYVRASSRIYETRLTKSIALKYRDEISNEEHRIALLCGRNKEAFIKRLEFLEKRAVSRLREQSSMRPNRGVDFILQCH